MRKNRLAQCPICNYKKATNLLNLNCGNLDNSLLYQLVRIKACGKCGHVYNKLSSFEITNLEKYYNEEYAPINIHAVYKTGGMPGGDSPLSVERYKKLFDFIRPHIKKSFKILDVGCANGGFLNYLHKQGLHHLYGIDPTVKFVKNAKLKMGYNIKNGSADLIPFKDNTFDAIVIDNVIEHLVNPGKALREIKRVLTPGGMLYIGAPNAANYRKASFEFLWFLFKEHIQHFDIRHIELLAAHEGFNLLNYREFNLPTTSSGLPIPAMGAIFSLSGRVKQPRITKDCFKLEKEMTNYATESFKKLNKKRKILNNLIISKRPIYIWGVASEFFYLYESLGLKKCNIVGLIDINSYKQKMLTVDGRRIRPPSILKKAIVDSALLICATIHTKEILEQLSKLSYRGQIIKI